MFEYFDCTGKSGYARCLRARRRLSLLLNQFQQPLSAPPRELPRGQPSSWDTGAGLDKGVRGRVLWERLGDRTHLCFDVVGLFLALHRLSLQHILALAQVMVSEYSRNHSRGRQARELTKEKRGESQSCVRTWGLMMCSASRAGVGHWPPAHAQGKPVSALRG